MTGIELLEKHPLSTTLIREWFLEKMLESLQTNDISEEFKEMMRAAGVENDKIATLIDINPRMLLDVFDDNKISINIERSQNKIVEWSWNIMEYYGEHSVCKSRKEAEAFAVEAAFDILEEGLANARIDVIAQNSNTEEHHESTIED